ncbi:hypothetical protein DUD43_09170 [Alcaligenes faecalis]|nr:hypothetical protein DUD43_09170 [Alcaligenes faecalis]
MLLQGVCRPINMGESRTIYLTIARPCGGLFYVWRRLMRDRRPVVLTPGAAREWTSSETGIETALELLSTARPETAFQWHPVTRQMSNVKYQAPNTDHPAAT